MGSGEKAKAGMRFSASAGLRVRGAMPLHERRRMTPFSELDELINAGWGSVRSEHIPADWRRLLARGTRGLDKKLPLATRMKISQARLGTKLVNGKYAKHGSNLG